MSSRFGRTLRVAWRALLAVVILVSVLLLLCNTNVVRWPHRTFELKKIRASRGLAYTAKLPAPWLGFVLLPNTGILTEDGRAMRRVAENGTVRDEGMGAFRVGGDRVLFSSSDGGNPLTNGRAYLLRLDTVVAPLVRLAILTGGGLAVLLLLWKILRALLPGVRRSIAENAGNMPAISARTVALVLFAFALAVRVGFLWLNPVYTDEKMSIRGAPFSDARDWHWMARSAATGHGVDSTYPGMRAFYPMFLANFYTWFGPSVPLAKGLQALIGAASASLLFLILRRATPLWPALAVALFFAVDPRQITQSGTLMTEPFGLLLIMLSAWCMIGGGERRRPALLVAAGAFFACSNLARPLTLFAFPLYVALIAANAWVRDSRRGRAALLHSGAFALGTAICLAPWVIRERVVHGIWSISCNSSTALFAASTPEFGVWGDGVEILSRKAGIPRNVKARYDFYQARFVENLKKYPGFYVSNVARSFRVAAMGGTNVPPHLRGLGLWAMAFAVVGVAFALWWRPFPAAVLVVCHFGGLLGSALFGNPDLQRVRLLIDWIEAGWTFAGVFAVGSVGVALLLRVPIRALPGGAARDAADEPPARWLRWIGWGFVGFLTISSSRLVFLNVFATLPPRMPLRYSDEERTAHLREFAARFPAWQRIADPALMAAPRSWTRRAFVEFGSIERDVYHFPANVGFQLWSGPFTPRPYEHTSFLLRVSGASFAGLAWTEFAGEIPPALRATPCLLIGLARSNPAPAYFENSIEAVAIIPAPDYKPDFAKAIVAPVSPETESLLPQLVVQ